MAIIVRENKVLLIRRVKEGGGCFVFPGGGVENNETPEQAVVREIKEESGLEIKIERQIFGIENQGRQEHYFLIKDFILAIAYALTEILAGVILKIRNSLIYKKV